MNIKDYLNEQRIFVEDQMQKYMLVQEGPFAGHIEAMRYSLFAGGKRIRPILCLASASAVAGTEIDVAVKIAPVAVALECIHTYSLIHDDLPAMDDDDLRRGKPTNHVLYGEAGAILAGDGLLTLAFDIISNRDFGELSLEQRLDICHIIARAAGSLGMVGGQYLDIESENREIDFDTLATIHRSKTGALIACAVRAGAIAASATEEQYKALTTYGEKVGLAFQIVDDLLDVISSTEELGKPAGSDEGLNKATYPKFFGIENTRKKAQEAVHAAIDALEIFNESAEPLREIARYIYTRTH